jgi:hypothetical protein
LFYPLVASLFFYVLPSSFNPRIKFLASQELSLKDDSAALEFRRLHGLLMFNNKNK